MGKIRVCRDFNTKEIYDVQDFGTGLTYGGSWRKLANFLPKDGWTRLSNAEVIIMKWPIQTTG
jgi:hypothetical protein